MDAAALGLLAGSLTTAAWLPQLHHTWRRRSADDISWPYLLTTGTGIALWLTYGVVDGDVAVTAANLVTLVLIIGLVALKASHTAPRAYAPTHTGDDRRDPSDG